MKKTLIIAMASVLGLALLAGFGLYFGNDASISSAGSKQATRSLMFHKEPKALPEVEFQHGTGRKLTLADFREKVVLLNVWATWCPPCREEMPTLDRLQGKLGGKDFEVLALSIDRAGTSVVRKFFNEIGVKHLALYIDPTAKAASTLKAVGLPVTLLLDREGREIARLIGPAEWDTPEMITLFEGVIDGRRTSQSASSHELAQQSPSTEIYR